MEIRVENPQFAPNHGGGGGTFYQGRRGSSNQDEQKDEHAQGEDGVPDSLAPDRCSLPATRRSTLGLVLPAVPLGEREPLPEINELDEDFHRSLRVMTLMMVQLERNFERRLHSEVGDVVIGA